MSATSLVEKYRPTNLDEVINQKLVVKKIKNMLDRGLYNNLLFVGPAGIGKTSIAQCIAREFYKQNWRDTVSGYFSDRSGGNWEELFRNYNGRDLTVTKINSEIKRYTEYMGRRIIFIDEADGLDKNDQQALRPIMEGSKNAIFILSCNDENSIHESIKSRTAVLKFRSIGPEDIRNKLFLICKEEDFIQPGDPPEINQFLMKLSRLAGGDARRAINELESYISESGLDMELIKDFLKG